MSVKSILNKFGATAAHKERFFALVDEHQQETGDRKEALRRAAQELKDDVDEQIQDVSKQISEKYHG